MRSTPWLTHAVTFVAVVWFALLATREVTRYAPISMAVGGAVDLLGEPPIDIWHESFAWNGPTWWIELAGTAAAERTPWGWFRHGLGPRTSLSVRARQTHAALNVCLVAPSAGQHLTVSFRGRVLERMELSGGEAVNRRYDLELDTDDANDVTFEYGVYNHHGMAFAEEDPRPLAGTFVRLSVDFLP